MNNKIIVSLQLQRLLGRKSTFTFNPKVSFSSDVSKKDDKSPSEVTKESLQWRTSWDRKGEWYSKLKVFASDSNNTNIIKFLQSPIDLRPSSIKKWYFRKMEEAERSMQQYIPERNQILGNDLAAAHFLVYRGGRVKFHGDENWTVLDDTTETKLPNKFIPHYRVKAIDCSKVNIFYEGLENFRDLEKLQWLCLKGCKNIDDWCMDRITGMFKDSLTYLDVRNCNITYRGVGALYKTTKLETLLIDNVTKSKEMEMTCLMLQELLPNLEIRNFE